MPAVITAKEVEDIIAKGGDPKSPARWLVVGIVDELEPGVPV